MGNSISSTFLKKNHVLKYDNFSTLSEMVDFFISSIDLPMVSESVDDSYIKKVLSSLSKDLKFNAGLIFTFGTGISLMVPIVQNLIKNGNLKIEASQENMILLSLTSLAILYLEEIKNKPGDLEIDCPDCKNGCDKCDGGKIKSKVTRSDAKTLLEELKMRGIGNGIVKKFVKAFKSIGNLIKSLFKGSKYPINGLLEMFGYTSLLIPVMNAINSLVGKYEFNVDTIVGNFLAIGAGITTFLAKNSINFLIDKLSKRIKLSKGKIGISPVRDIMDGESDSSGKLISENNNSDQLDLLIEIIEDEIFEDFKFGSCSWSLGLGPMFRYRSTNTSDNRDYLRSNIFTESRVLLNLSGDLKSFCSKIGIDPNKINPLRLNGSEFFKRVFYLTDYKIEKVEYSEIGILNLYLSNGVQKWV